MGAGEARGDARRCEERFNILWEEYNTLMENQLNPETKQTPAQMQGESGDGGQRGTLGSHRRARPSCDVNGVTRMTSAASHVRHLEPHACKTGNENREK